MTKIIAIYIDGIKNLKAIEMVPTSNGLIPIVGKNSSGKTSIIEALEILFRGNKYIKADMVTHGKDKAQIIAELDDYTICKIIYNDNRDPILKITKDNVKILRPQEFLNKLTNELIFNPFPFINKTTLEKKRFIMDFLNINFDNIDNELNKLEIDRKTQTQLIKAYGEPEKVEKIEKININNLYQEKNQIIESNNKLRSEYLESVNKIKSEIMKFNIEQNSLTEKRNNLISDKNAALNYINQLESKLKQWKHELNNIETRLNNLPEIKSEKGLTDIKIKEPEYKSTQDIDQQINIAIANNQSAERYNEYLIRKDKYNEMKIKHDIYDKKINKLRKDKDSILKNAAMPISGLEIRDDGIYLDGIHCENWSDSENIKISAELCQSMKPPLKAIFIDRGESFDNNRLKELESFASNNDIQCFITLVDEDMDKYNDNKNVIILEEGEIK